jgi:hypothetical protein
MKRGAEHAEYTNNILQTNPNHTAPDTPLLKPIELAVVVAVVFRVDRIALNSSKKKKELVIRHTISEEKL